MKICILEHPRIRSVKRFNDIANTPLWSCLMGGYAAATLEKVDHDVIFWDTTFSKWDFERTTREIRELAPALLCINTVYIWEHTPIFFEFIASLKSKGFTGHINLFGFFPTLAWEAILEEDTAVDSIAVGEFEHTLAHLAEHLETGADPGNIPGLALSRADGTHILKKRGVEKNLDRFQTPVRDCPPGSTVSILGSRGCYNHCRFCPIPSFYNNGPLWNGRSPKHIFEEICQLVEQGFTDFYFADPNFIGPGTKGRERTLELLNLISPLNITFGMETRPNDLTPGILDKLVAAGLNSLLLGIESGSKSVLGSLDKYSSRSVSEKALRLCREAGIEPEVGFLMFVPDSTASDLKDNFEFLKNNSLLDRLDRTANLLSHCQIVLLGTSGYARFKEEGRLKPAGMFGFEGAVAFRDEAVAWMSELVIYACHDILRNMEKKESPVYWERPPKSSAHIRLNDYLVSMFERLLQWLDLSPPLPPVTEKKNELATDLRKLIDQG